MLARLVTAALSSFMALNIAVTLLARPGEQRAAGVPATTSEQRFFDEHFPDSYLQSAQNMSVYGRDRLQPRPRGVFQQRSHFLPRRRAARAAGGEVVERFLQVDGQVVREAQALPRDGMLERQLERVQELAVEAEVSAGALSAPGRVAGCPQEGAFAYPGCTRI